MPDPARLTDEQIEEALAWGDEREVIELLLPALRADRARLAAAENVVEAARQFTVRVVPTKAWSEIATALAAYDAQKEPTGNHAESSATRGDTNE